MSVYSTVKTSIGCTLPSLKVTDLVRQAVWWRAGGVPVVYIAAEFGSP